MRVNVVVRLRMACCACHEPEKGFGSSFLGCARLKMCKAVSPRYLAARRQQRSGRAA